MSINELQRDKSAGFNLTDSSSNTPKIKRSLLGNRIDRLFSYINFSSFLLLLPLVFWMCSGEDNHTSTKDLSSPSTIKKAVGNNNIEKDSFANNSGTFTDSRDGQTYTWVELADGKKWMSQNLNYETTDSWCAYDKESNCEKYGRLYTWSTAQKVCPKGWRLPSDEEWWNMTSKYGKAYSSFEFVKNHGKGVYSPYKKNIGEDAGKAAYQALKPDGSTTFSAQFGGYRHTQGGYYHIKHLGCYWASTENDDINALGYNFIPLSIQNVSRALSYKTFAKSCRCIQD